MDFNRLAQEFDGIINRHSGTNRDPQAVVLEIRMASADAGREVLLRIKRGEIPPPVPAPFWYTLATGGFNQTRFAGCRAAGYLDWRIWPRQTAEEFVSTIYTTSQAHASNAEPEDAGHPPTGLVHRHVFYEAASGWLASRLETGSGYVPSIPRAMVATCSHDTLEQMKCSADISDEALRSIETETEILFDWIRWSDAKPGMSWALPFAWRARALLRKLHDEAESVSAPPMSPTSVHREEKTLVETIGQFAQPSHKDRERSHQLVLDDDPTPLTDQETAVITLLATLGHHQALTGPNIISALEENNTFLDQSGLTKRIIPVLKRRCGVVNKPRVGYFIDPDDPRRKSAKRKGI